MMQSVGPKTAVIVKWPIGAGMGNVKAYTLFDLSKDYIETINLFKYNPKIEGKMKSEFFMIAGSYYKLVAKEITLK